MSRFSHYWFALLDPHYMSNDWQLRIGNLLQVPYSYVIHDTTNDDVIKSHVHVFLVFPNTTSQEHVLSLLNALSTVDSFCCSACQPVISIRHVYDYLTHDSYSSPVTGNGFRTLFHL